MTNAYKTLLFLGTLLCGTALSINAQAGNSHYLTDAWIEMEIMNYTDHVGQCMLLNQKGHHTQVVVPGVALAPHEVSEMYIPWNNMPTNSKGQEYTNAGTLYCETYDPKAPAVKLSVAAFHFHSELTNTYHHKYLGIFGSNSMAIIKKDLSLGEGNNGGIIGSENIYTYHCKEDSWCAYWDIKLGIH